MLEGLAILQEIEAELGGVIGPPALKVVLDALTKIVRHEQQLASVGEKRK